MQKLDNNYFPHAGMKDLRFRTVDGTLHTGRYDFNEIWARRWIDENNTQYTSDEVLEWEEVCATKRCVSCGKLILNTESTIFIGIGSSIYSRSDDFCLDCKQKEYRTIQNELDAILRMHGFTLDSGMSLRQLHVETQDQT